MAVALLPRRMLYAGALISAGLIALWIIWQGGRAAGVAKFAVKRAEARLRILKQAAEVRHDVDADDDPGVARRLSRWMRD